MFFVRYITINIIFNLASRKQMFRTLRDLFSFPFFCYLFFCGGTDWHISMFLFVVAGWLSNTTKECIAELTSSLFSLGMILAFVLSWQRNRRSIKCDAFLFLFLIWRFTRFIC